MTTVFFSGAGISAESGIPTYRGTDGVYEKENVSDILHATVQKKNPQLVYDTLEQARKLVEKAQPNRAHKAIAKYVNQHPTDTYVVTQNVDDMFEKAGIDTVLHVHGEITKFRNEDGRKRHDVVLFGEVAPGYYILNTLLDCLTPSDAIVVIGTSGMVVSINEIISTLPCKKYLNNLEYCSDINEDLFDHVILAPASIGVPRICEMIR
jgi:NAD-dependent deacetylase